MVLISRSQSFLIVIKNMTHFKFLLIILLFMLCACSKEDKLIEQISDSLQGEYKCVSMTWCGSAIDMDGDGTPNTDLIKEFSSYENASPAIKSSAYLYPINKYNQANRLSLSIPMQYIKFNKVSRQYSLMNGELGGRNYVVFSFAVHEDGSISFFAINENPDDGFNVFWENDSEIEGLDYRSTCAHHVLYFKEGTFAVRIIGTYYDFASQQLVTGPVDLTYERVSYSVN